MRPSLSITYNLSYIGYNWDKISSLICHPTLLDYSSSASEADYLEFVQSDLVPTIRDICLIQIVEIVGSCSDYVFYDVWSFPSQTKLSGV